ncbi:MAG: hypothetical protein ACAI35_03025 [Candidatus Methylacidiphilales bacterium]
MAGLHFSCQPEAFQPLDHRGRPALYTLAEELSGLSYQTLRNYKSVCEQICLSRRRDKLSFKHHVKVIGIDDPAIQDDWLDQAEQKNWSASDLCAAIRLAARTEEPVKDKE